jgi:hypothetical protein
MMVIVEQLVEWRLAGETCPSPTLSTANRTWSDPCSNPDRRGEKPATNRLSYGVAFVENLISFQKLPLEELI